jgi:hypothetical protein
MVVGGRGGREKEGKIVDGDWRSCFMVADCSGWWWSALVGGGRERVEEKKIGGESEEGK